jgi:hypothetical protein
MNENKTPQSVFDIEALEQDFRQPDFIEIPLPRGGVLVMRTNVDVSEWRDIPRNAGAWMQAVKESPFWDELGCDAMTSRDLINAFIFRHYSIPEMSDAAAIRFVKALRLGVVDILDQFENGIRLMDAVRMQELLEKKKGS